MKQRGSGNYNQGRHRKKERALLFSVTLIFLLVLGGGVAAVLWLLPNPLQPNMETVTFHEYHALNPNQTYIVLEGVILTDLQIQTFHGEIHLPLSFVSEFAGPHLFWEPEHRLLTLSTQTAFTRMTPDSLDVYTNMVADTSDWMFQQVGEMAYLPLSFIREHFDLRVDEADFLVITPAHVPLMVYTTAFLEEGIPIRHEPTILSYVSETLVGGATVTALSDALYFDPEEILEHGFIRVITPSGRLGYIEDSHLVSLTPALLEPFTNQVPLLPPVAHSLTDTPLNVAWDLVTNFPAANAPDRRVTHQGVNVMAPKWLRFERTYYSGALENISSREFVNWAHANDLQVWPLLFDYEDPQVASRIFSQPHLRDQVITQLIDIALDFNFDGLMMDIEGTNGTNHHYYLQFLRELSPMMRIHELVYSAAVFVPAPWRPWYEHGEIGRVVDYLAVMAYDQNVAWTANNLPEATAGPNASIGFVTEAIDYLTHVMDSDRIILGLPFYTRIWYITDDGYGNRHYAQRTVGIQFGQLYFTRDFGVPLQWSDYYGSYYASFISMRDGVETLTRAWVESERSLALKTELFHSHNLAGVAGWQRGLASAETWVVIDEVLRR